MRYQVRIKQMEIIPVKPHPYEQTFYTIESAVAHAMSHARRSEAQANAAELKGSTLVDAYWTLSEFVLQFSNNRWLHISISNAAPTWQLLNVQPVLRTHLISHIGAAPIYLDWQNFLGRQPMDASGLVAKRIGFTLTNLFINHTGFFVYFRDHLVFQFHAAYRTDTGNDILFVTEDN